ncbi:MetI-like domain [Syntrophomonas zehnderi OL-4]|uniref:MetI-like domain n=2 Tax=Syntrophomonas TaxID=862 RepID=A0A0E4GCQ5_9FIRM|nr:MetI-like domain [Syntrophomonas zehnderi OL-4]CFX87838.1 MetI-like domain [Syntrophomonas zehnderi OL-4]
MDLLPRIPINRWTDIGIEYLQIKWGGGFDSLSEFLKGFIISLQDLLIFIPPALMILILALLAWRFINKKAALFGIIGLYLIYNVGLWGATMQTLAMVISSVVLCIILGIPLGILAAKSDTAHQIITPILDFMQTLPAFVYLLPAVTFFGLGVVPAAIATLIFAMPPVIRLTDLGIKQVPEELVELGHSFGSTFHQMLFKIELPLARPTIMAGINQCIMLSLSMVVISAMIGAKGLGGEVWRAIQRMEIGNGFEAGLAIVVIAILLDRITQSFGKNED